MNQTLPLTHWELVFDSDVDGPEIEKLLNKNSNAHQPGSISLSVIKE
jgi:hypothetical protein